MLTTIGMAIGVLIEALLPGGDGVEVGGGKPPPKDEAGAREWVRNKLTALASLPGRLCVKADEELPDIIRAILSWILLNKASYAVGWILQNSMGFGCRYWRVALHVHGYQDSKNYIIIT